VIVLLLLDSSVMNCNDSLSKVILGTFICLDEEKFTLFLITFSMNHVAGLVADCSLLGNDVFAYWRNVVSFDFIYNAYGSLFS